MSSALRHSFSTFLCLTVMSCGGSESPAPDVADIEFAAALSEQAPRYTVQLNGTQVIPAVDTRETAVAEFALDESTGQLYGSLTTSIGSGVIDVHLHEGNFAETGAIIVALVETTGVTGNRTFGVPAAFTLTAAQQVQYENGALYVDLHAPNVSLRGQLSLQQPTVAIAPTLNDLQANVFTPVCSGCHTGAGNNLPAIMSLTSAQQTYQSMVGVLSIGEPQYLRVEPGNADNSLLVKKIEGTHTVGSRMPFRGARLDAETIQAIRDWIDAGASQ